MDPKQSYGAAYNATSTFASGSATAVQAGTSGRSLYVTDVSASSDRGTAIAQIKDNATVIWQDRISNTSPYILQFKVPLRISAGSAVSVTVDGVGTAFANISGYLI